MQRWLPHLLTVGALVLPGLIYSFDIRWQGFPDGHLTDLDRAHRVLWQVFSAVSFVVAAAALILSRGGESESPRVRQLALLYGGVIVVFEGAAYFFRFFFDHGVGG